jgi:hypothetical protein
MAFNGLALDPRYPAFWVASGGFALLCCVLLRLRAPANANQMRLRDFSESTLAMLLIFVMGALANYSEAAQTSGFYDAALEQGDRLLHFDWLALYMLVAAHPVLQYAGELAYASVYVSPLVILGWFAWHGERNNAHGFLITFWFAATLTLLIFPLIPARGALEFLWHGPIRYMPTNGLYQGEIIPALRSHAISHIDLGSVKGLVCAPSFHTACALIFMAFAWPHALLRQCLVPLNMAMLMATPVEGTHYLTDMLLGALVALASIAAVRTLQPRLEELAIMRLR